MNEQTIPIDDESTVRGQWYGFLAMLFASALDETRLESLRALDGSVDSTGELNTALNALIAKAKIKDTRQIKREFSDVYIGIGRGEVIPYSSWHITGFLMEKPLADLRTDMKRLGIARREDIKEPEDGIAFLLESMAHLVSRPIRVQQDFFETHLSNWVDSLFEETEKAKTADFYKDVTRLLKEWILVERQYFGQELSDS